MTQKTSIRWRVGERLSASKLNLLAEQVETREDLFRNPNGRPAGQVFRLLQVRSLDDVARTIECVPYGMQDIATYPNAATFTVMLPRLFYEATRDTNTYVYTTLNARTVNGAVTEEITPNIIIGDEILCMWETSRAAWRMIMEGRMWAEV